MKRHEETDGKGGAVVQKSRHIGHGEDDIAEERKIQKR